MQEAQTIGEISEQTVRDTLATINYPGLTRDLVSFGMVRHVSVCGAQVKVTLALRSADPTTPVRLRDEITTRLGALGATSVAVVIEPPAAAPAPARHGTPDPWADCVRLASVRHVIAVGAGGRPVRPSGQYVGAEPPPGEPPAPLAQSPQPSWGGPPPSPW